jgi:hypothetical protein
MEEGDDTWEGMQVDT